MEVVQVVLVLFVLCELIMDFLVAFPDVLDKHRHAMWVVRANVVGREGDVSREGLAYLGICNIREGHEVLEEVGDDVLLVGKYTP